MPNDLKRYRLVDDRKVDLDSFDTRAPVVDAGDHDANEAALKSLQKEIAAYQYKLFAERTRSLLLVLQGMDTSGKDGATIATFDQTHPQGLYVASFKVPSADEAAHDFLWRVHARTPAKGMIAVFNRSHYEAVIAERVLGFADKAECRRRCRQIVDFERMLVAHGTCIVKCFLHISPDEQKQRLQARVDDPTKQWKFNPGDLVERKRWDTDRAAYEDAIRRTATKEAPWWIVPSDAETHRNLMVATIVRDALAELDPQYPALPADLKGLKIA